MFERRRDFEGRANELHHSPGPKGYDFTGPGCLASNITKRFILCRLRPYRFQLPREVPVADLFVLRVIQDRKIADGVAGRETLVVIGKVFEPLGAGFWMTRQNMLGGSPGEFGGQALHTMQTGLGPP